MSDVGKATDGMLDMISALQQQRDQTLSWIEIYVETGELASDHGEFLARILKGEE